MRIALALGLRPIALITLVAPPGDSYRTRLNCHVLTIRAGSVLTPKYA